MPASAIDLDPEEFRRLAHRAVDMLADRLASVRDAPVRQPVPASLRDAWLAAPAPRAPADPEALLDTVERAVLAHPMGNASPRFFAWVNSPPAPLGVIADLLASGLNPSVAGGDHAGTYIEHAVLNWLKNIVGAPPDAGAVLTSGGSVATLVGLAVMRHVKTGGLDRRRGLAERDGRLIVYASTQGHACIQKAVEILGFGSDQLHRVPVDADFRMDLTALQSRDRPPIGPADCTRWQSSPARARSTPAPSIRSRRSRISVHQRISGCTWTAPTAASPRSIRRRVRSSRASNAPTASASIRTSGFTSPSSAAARSSGTPGRCATPSASCRRTLRDDAAMPWFSEFTVQQTRGFRALKLWMVLQQVGLDAYGRLIAGDIARARTLRVRLRRHGDFEIVSEGPLSITCFRYVPAWARDVDALNRRIADHVQREGRVFITTTELDGRSVLRACTVNFRTTDADLDALIDAIVSSADACR